jgi:hypothetical protein
VSLEYRCSFEFGFVEDCELLLFRAEFKDRHVNVLNNCSIGELQVIIIRELSSAIWLCKRYKHLEVLFAFE